MSLRLYSIRITAPNGKPVDLPVYGELSHAAYWRSTGLDVWEMVNTIPDWMPAPLVRPWCRLQSLFLLDFRHAFGKGE